ncbi:hypothetical protein HII31_07655 [Pseudocercospora fuligena]|uniref:Uncharacterized protein n=1 Tax=Pseudocercospora fuligena TaxID=685502 RepID=A0A8H6RJ75_9PEZI|nr:hypothetical protein HII31_07655 [Pseudocercospora fuligena]
MVAIKFLLLTTLLALGEAAAVQDKKPPKKPTEAQQKKIKAATEKFIKNKAVVKPKGGGGGLGESKLASNKDSDGKGQKFGEKCPAEQHDKDDRFQCDADGHFPYACCKTYKITVPFIGSFDTCAITCNTKETCDGLVQGDIYGNPVSAYCDNCRPYGFCDTSANKMFKMK